MKRFLSRKLGGRKTKTTLPQPEISATSNSAEELSPREAEVLKLVAAGLSDKEIGQQLKLSTRTISNYLGRIYQKLEVKNRADCRLC